MTYDYPQTDLSRSILGGLFAGLIACGATQIYNIVYRSITGFSLSDIINVSTLIFLPVIALVIAGIAYYFLTKMKSGVIIYILFFGVLTFITVMSEMHIQRSGDPVISAQFKWLFIGITLIIGVIAVFVLPFVTKRNVLVD